MAGPQAGSEDRLYQRSSGKQVMCERIAFHTGQTLHRIEEDRDRWFAAAEAKDYGFVDEVVRGTGEVISENR